MPKHSAGILVYRTRNGLLEVLLMHPGGPFWAKKDVGAWSIPKGEHGPGDDPLACALREFEEETGSRLEADALVALGTVSQRSGKVVTAWAVEGDLDTATVRSNTFTTEWPPRSGQMREFPEVDRAQWFTVDVARTKLLPAQTAFLDRLVEAV